MVETSNAGLKSGGSRGDGRQAYDTLRHGHRDCDNVCGRCPQPRLCVIFDCHRMHLRVNLKVFLLEIQGPSQGVRARTEAPQGPKIWTKGPAGPEK